jgi:hypothetical protein
LGRRFEEENLDRLGSSVHHPSSSPRGSFFLFAVFRCSSFCLMEESVGMALHAVLGGSPGGCHISCEKPCHFRFSVASKAVGFLVAAKKHITTQNFDVYFSLWRNGGAIWQGEIKCWEEEEESSWTMDKKEKPFTNQAAFAYSQILSAVILHQVGRLRLPHSSSGF